jgi:hypothetical protein
MKIDEVKSTVKTQRISAHSHVKVSHCKSKFSKFLLNYIVNYEMSYKLILVN